MIIAGKKGITTVRKHPEKYGVKHFIKFGDYNVGRDGNLLTLPTYMQFLLEITPEKIVLEPIDISGDFSLRKSHV